LEKDLLGGPFNGLGETLHPGLVQPCERDFFHTIGEKFLPWEPSPHPGLRKGAQLTISSKRGLIKRLKQRKEGRIIGSYWEHPCPFSSSSTRTWLRYILEIEMWTDYNAQLLGFS